MANKLTENEKIYNEVKELLSDTQTVLENQQVDSSYEHAKWIKLNAQLKFLKQQDKEFPILNNHIYWAFLGSNIGSEQDKHRPVLVTRTSKKSPICTVIPLTDERLNDELWYHIDLQNMQATALVEQMRVIDKKRIDKPFRTKGRILNITAKDWEDINRQIISIYSLKPLENEKQNKK